MSAIAYKQLFYSFLFHLSNFLLLSLILSPFHPSLFIYFFFLPDIKDEINYQRQTKRRRGKGRREMSKPPKKVKDHSMFEWSDNTPGEAHPIAIARRHKTFYLKSFQLARTIFPPPSPAPAKIIALFCHQKRFLLSSVHHIAEFSWNKCGLRLDQVTLHPRNPSWLVFIIQLWQSVLSGEQQQRRQEYVSVST